MPNIPLQGTRENSSEYRSIPSGSDVERTLEDEAIEASFVSCWPKKLNNESNESTSLSFDDFSRTYNSWSGGCILSVYDSGAADGWIDANYDHPCLVALRENNIRGPIASMLSVESAALTIFGTISTLVIQMANQLAELSGFPVMIKPPGEYPRFENHPTTSANVQDEGGSNKDQSTSTKQNRSSAPSGSRSHQTRNKRNAKGQSVGDDNTSDELPEDDDDDNPPDPPPIAGTSSTRKEIRHETNICLQVLIAGKSIGKLKVITKIKFYPAPNPKPMGSSEKPLIEGHVHLEARTNSPSIDTDGAIGSVGFLAHDKQGDYLRTEDFVSLGYDVPDFKRKIVSTKQHPKAITVGGGLSGIMPVLTAAVTVANINSSTAEVAEDTVATPWVVVPEYTNDGWHEHALTYCTLNAKIFRWPPAKEQLYQKYFPLPVMKAEYGISMDVAQDIENLSDTPKVSFVCRHQIHCWVAVETKAKSRGVIVLATQYIPDITTKKELWIKEDPVVDLMHRNVERDHEEGKASCKIDNTSAGPFAFGTAIMPETTSRTFRDRIRESFLRGPESRRRLRRRRYPSTNMYFEGGITVPNGGTSLSGRN